MPVDEKLMEIIRAQEHPESMSLIEREMLRVEALFQQAPPRSPEWSELIRAMTAISGQLNHMVAAACLYLKYPLRQWEWADSRPLEAVAQAYPNLGLEVTEWYQRHLSLMLMAPLEPNHPWWGLEQYRTAIRTSANPAPSD